VARSRRPFRPQLTALEGREVPATFTVTNSGDSGPGSLEFAIDQANGNGNPGVVDVINFAIPFGSVIQPDVNGLPQIKQPLFINGYSVAGSVVNTQAVGDNAKIGVTLDGSQTNGGYGLTIDSPNCTVAGLAIGRFAGGIFLTDKASGTVIRGNFIGTDATGTLPRGNEGYGVYADNSDLNVIGGNFLPDRNVIVGSDVDGIHLAGAGSAFNAVRNNYIGVAADGSTPVPNGGWGVYSDDANGTEVGNANGGGNVISANVKGGVRIEGAGVTFGTVKGNVIGLAAGGYYPLGNFGDGVYVDQAGGVAVGGAAAGEGNTVSANLGSGVVYVSAPNAVVRGNVVGLTAFGGLDRGNFGSGVIISDTANAVVGGAGPGQGNILSGNGGDGVEIYKAGSAGAKVLGNIIGLGKDGYTPVGNLYGVAIDDAPNVRIGGPGAGERNVISANQGTGVFVSELSANPVIQGNYIGTDADGQRARGNGGYGIDLRASFGQIGGTDPGAGNVIAASGGYGVSISDTAQANKVFGNRIGTDADGTTAFGNGVGVYVRGFNNAIGAPLPGAGNLIAGSANAGVEVDGASNLVAGNLIGTNPALPAYVDPASLGNGYGVRFGGSATDNVVGTLDPGAANVIAYSRHGGLFLEGSGNSVRGNSVYLNGFGAAPLGAVNDPQDADTGDNGLQNVPVLTGYTVANGTTTVTGTLNTTPNTAVLIELFANFPNPAGDYEGQFYLGEVAVTTDANGDAAFSFATPAGDPGTRFTATQTNLGSHETSVFSAPLAIPDLPPPAAGGYAGGFVYADANGNGQNDAGEGLAGVLVYLDRNNDGQLDGEPATVTGPSGEYNLGSELSGTFAVRVVAPAGYQAVTPPQTVTLAGGAAVEGIDFAFQPTPAVPPPPAADTAPAITTVADVTATAGVTTAPIPFLVLDAETPAVGLTVTATSSNPALLSDAGVVITGNGSQRTVTLHPAAGATGTAAVTLTVSDGTLTTAETFTVTVTDPQTPPPPGGDGQGGDGQGNGKGGGVLDGSPGDGQGNGKGGGVLDGSQGGGDQKASDAFAVGADAGGDGTVTVYNPDGTPRYTVTPFPGVAGGVRVALADFNGDGVPDLAAATGPGTQARVRVLDGVTRQELFAFAPFGTFGGGAYVAAGDVDGDGRAELVVTPDEGGGPRVQVLRGGDFAVTADFYGIGDPDFRGGARAAVGDLNADGRADVLVSAGFQGGPRVAGYDGATLAAGPRKLFADFFLFEPDLRNGAYVAVGDLDGDGFGDVIGGGGPDGGPRVVAVGGKALVQSGQLAPLANFFTADPANRSGVRVAAKDLDGDGRTDVLTGAGAGTGSRVAAYAGKAIGGDPAPTLAFDALPGFHGGVYVG
jgi:hypothetical protein